MMRRYKFLTKKDVYVALNKLRAAFLAAKDGSEVDEIIMGLLTNDERLKIGRRIQIAAALNSKVTYREICKALKVGIQTVSFVDSRMKLRPKCYELIDLREYKVKKEYKEKSVDILGGSKTIFKRRIYTGFKHRDVKR